jgi:hypothetical protein
MVGRIILKVCFIIFRVCLHHHSELTTKIIFIIINSSSVEDLFVNS